MANESASLNKGLNEKSEQFISKMNSDMHYKADLSSNILAFDWLDEVEGACIYIDNAVRNPKVLLIKEEDTVKIEKAKKITVASVKDLSRHTHYIEKVDKKTNEVEPSKILIERSEETFNFYENRFLYTLIDNLSRFIRRKEELLEDLQIKNDKTLEYAGSTISGRERVKIELKISSNELPNDDPETADEEMQKEIDRIKKRIERIKQFIMSWHRSELFKALDKAHVRFVIPPIKKTNIILKNPNFQVAMKLWDLLQRYDDPDKEADGLDTSGNNLLKGILDDAFLMNYFVLDSISSSRREQKEKLAEYAVVMINQQIKRVVSLLLNSGIKISEQEIIEMIMNEINNERNKSMIDSTDVKNKFKSEFEDYLNKAKGIE